MRILIIGIGNPLQGDDALGWNVAGELSKELQRDDIQVLAMHQLTPELSELASRAERMLFIDAARTGDPGTLRLLPITPDASRVRHSHALTPETLLGMAKKLYGRCPPAYLLTIVGDSFEIGQSLSAVVRDTLPALHAEVHRLISRDSWGEIGGKRI